MTSKTEWRTAIDQYVLQKQLRRDGWIVAGIGIFFGTMLIPLVIAMACLGRKMNWPALALVLIGFIALPLYVGFQQVRGMSSSVGWIRVRGYGMLVIGVMCVLIAIPELRSQASGGYISLFAGLFMVVNSKKYFQTYSKYLYLQNEHASQEQIDEIESIFKRLDNGSEANDKEFVKLIEKGIFPRVWCGVITPNVGVFSLPMQSDAFSVGLKDIEILKEGEPEAAKGLIPVKLTLGDHVMKAQISSESLRRLEDWSAGKLDRKG